MTEPHKIWIEQCEAARGIKENFGSQKALGYLIGEKLVNFIYAADERKEFADELPKFIEEIRNIFSPLLIREYLEKVQRIGASGHVCTQEEYHFLRAADAIDRNPIDTAEDILILKRIKKMLL